MLTLLNQMLFLKVSHILFLSLVSFILVICIAPLEGNYSDVLPAQ